jgi:hypothetical protein
MIAWKKAAAHVGRTVRPTTHELPDCWQWVLAGNKVFTVFGTGQHVLHDVL